MSVAASYEQSKTLARVAQMGTNNAVEHTCTHANHKPLWRAAFPT
eukprot:COSAG01_NODE_2258_length_8063_cov_10.409216_3_plen_45_part_00